MVLLDIALGLIDIATPRLLLCSRDKDRPIRLTPKDRSHAVPDRSKLFPAPPARGPIDPSTPRSKHDRPVAASDAGSVREWTAPIRSPSGDTDASSNQEAEKDSSKTFALPDFSKSMSWLEEYHAAAKDPK